VAHKILRTSFTDPLKKARYLGDYEAIVTSPDWESLIGLNGPRPGKEMLVDQMTISETQHELEERAGELVRFLESGGVLVVKVQAASSLWFQGPYPTAAVEIDSVSWMSVQVFPLLQSSFGDRGRSAFQTGRGHEIEFLELDHPLEAVIRGAREYSGRILKTVFDVADTTVLATTRIGDPVAGEIPVGPGLVFLVPSGVDDKDLFIAVNEILETRERQRKTWYLPEESALIEEERAVRAEAREKAGNLAERRQALADLRVELIKSNVNLARAISYYENGTSATRPIDRAMHDLYKLVELLEGNFGHSEDQLAEALTVPKSLFKDRIKRLANQPPLDFRHATSGETVGADVAKVEQAREAARILVQRFVEHCCDEERKRRAANAEASSATR